ncbi:MAG: helix-turn-helix domain-containing protein [Candidatus Hadarchaeota archaeon]
MSRRGRTKLVKLLLNKGWSKAGIAKMVGVTRQAVHKWLRREETHPCNLNLCCLLDLSLKTNRAEAIAILREELKTFQNLFSEKCRART